MRAIMDQYNVQIIPRPKQKNFHAMTIVVKGCEWECARVKEATLLLMEHLCKVRNNIDFDGSILHRLIYTEYYMYNMNIIIVYSEQWEWR